MKLPYAPTPEVDYQPIGEEEMRMIEEGALPSGKGEPDVDQLINELMLEEEESKE